LISEAAVELLRAAGDCGRAEAAPRVLVVSLPRRKAHHFILTSDFILSIHASSKSAFAQLVKRPIGSIGSIKKYFQKSAFLASSACPDRHEHTNAQKHSAAEPQPKEETANGRECRKLPKDPAQSMRVYSRPFAVRKSTRRWRHLRADPVALQGGATV
jgi:hypothetical protein